jgi:hypothetical protein
MEVVLWKLERLGFRTHEQLPFGNKTIGCAAEWAAPNKSSPARFDIKARTGYYLGAEWVAEAGRHAQIYVFAHHPVTDSSADHCDPRQWQFHVVATTQLPPSKSISLKAVSALAPAVSWNGLRDAVEEVRRSCGF